MNVQEAIEHCKEKIDCTECGQEHKQLSEWLEELVQYQERQVELSHIIADKLQREAEIRKLIEIRAADEYYNGYCQACEDFGRQLRFGKINI